MTDAIGYTRLSQTSDTSIANQTANIRAYADENGFGLVDILDDGEHASGFEPATLTEYERLKRRVVDDDLDAVIVNAKRRLVRDENEVMRLVADLRSNDVELHTHQSGQVDLSEPINAAIEILRAASAAEEKRKEIERAKEAIQRKQARGDDLGRPKFGMEYSDDGTEQVPGDRWGDVVDILLMRDNGYTFPAIADELDVPVGTVHRVVQRRDWYAERGSVEPQNA